MSKAITIANPKGGTGKTTVADELAFSLAKRGIPISFVNLDNQGGALHETSKARNARFLITDTPGSLSEKTIEALKRTDVLLIPVMPSVRGLKPLINLLEAANEHCPNAIVGMVINSYDKRQVASKEFDGLVEKQGWVVASRFPHSTLFVRAATLGKGVVDVFEGSHASNAVEELTDWLIKIDTKGE